ncbi:MAG TPA: hypothetical protein VJ810_21545, partial [Blastocatellia bacterium]|nr:hypothetical protein [Blastocatellia bacterium]
MKVDSGQWAVGSEKINTALSAYCPLPTAHCFLRSRSCRERRPETMKINHEETKNTKIHSFLSS